MRHVSIGGKFSLLIDEHGHLYTWGEDNRKGQLGRDQMQEDMMPQIVEHLEQKYVTYAVCGQDFGLALGQNFDQDGNVIEGEMEFTNHSERIQGPPGDMAGDISKISNIQPSAHRDNTSFLTNPVKEGEQRAETPQLNQRQEYTPSYQARTYDPPQRDYTPSSSYIASKEHKPSQDYTPQNDRYTRQSNAGDDSLERANKDRPQINNRVTEYRTYNQQQESEPKRENSSSASLPPLSQHQTKEAIPSARYERTDNTTTAEGYAETVSSAERQARSLRQQAAVSNSNVELYNQLSQLREEAF